MVDTGDFGLFPIPVGCKQLQRVPKEKSLE